jgi:hypothetical protein
MVRAAIVVGVDKLSNCICKAARGWKTAWDADVGCCREVVVGSDDAEVGSRRRALSKDSGMGR